MNEPSHSHDTSDAGSHKTGVLAWQQVLIRYSTGVVVESLSSKIVNFPKV